MVGKLCAGPTHGGSGRSLARYILGYELGSHEKNEGATPKQRRDAFHALLQEGLARPDYGVGVIWSPVVGDGTRPSSVYAKNVTSVTTADMEMDALASIAKSRRVREPVLHFVFSVNPADSDRLSDKQIILAAERALQKIDLGANAQVHSIHRDTDHAHVHVAVAAVNATTLQSWERSRNFYRLSWALREVEIEMGLPHDRGLAVVRQDEHGISRVEWASREELRAWERERTEERLEDVARKYAEDYHAYEDPQSWVADVVVPRLREYVEEAQSRGEALRWSDMHVIAAQMACRLERDGASGLQIRLMERMTGEGELGGDRDLKTDSFGEPMMERERRQREMQTPAILVRAEDLIGGRPEHAWEQEAYKQREAFLRRYVDAVEAERDFVAQALSDPGLVSREIVAGGSAVFSRDDLDRFLGERISDADTLSQVSQEIERRDGSLVMLSADAQHPLFTTQAQKTLEERVVAKAGALAKERDLGFNREALEEAIRQVERDRGITVSDEQRNMLMGLERRLSWVNGEAGTGKTTVLAAARRYSELTSRKIVGLTTAQSAAAQLQRESGAFALNSVRALVNERFTGTAVVKANAIVMLDETSMIDMRIMDQVLDRVRKQNAIVIGIGDAAQLPAIAAGDTHRLMCEVTQKAGSYSELHEVRRQRDKLEWLRPIVRDLGRSIREGDEAGVVRNIHTMAKHDAFDFRDDRKATLRAAADIYVEHYEKGEPIILNVDSRLDARHLNREIRERLRITGGPRFKTSQGVAQATVGDRIVFLKNDKSLSVLNGHTASIESVIYDDMRGAWQISARLDDRYGGGLITYDPNRYRTWAYGHAVTTHKSQGQSIYADVHVITHKISDARLAHVGWTRGESVLRVIVSQEAYASVTDLAQGVAERTMPKSDAILYHELEQRYGGPDTFWAINVRRAQADLTNPLRQEYLRGQRQVAQRREDLLHGINTQYQRQMALPGLTDKQRKLIEHKHRTATKHAIEMTRPQTFVAWAGERRRAELIEHQGLQLMVAQQARHQRDLEREARRGHSRKIATLERCRDREAPDPDRNDSHKLARSEEHEHLR